MIKDSRYYLAYILIILLVSLPFFAAYTQGSKGKIEIENQAEPNTALRQNREGTVGNERFSGQRQNFIYYSARSMPAGHKLITRGNSSDQRGIIRVGARGHDNKTKRLGTLLNRKSPLYMEATGYSPGRRSTWPHTDGTTALGMPAGYGIAAVDHSYIPLGTLLYVEGYGYALAADTGGAIHGNRIDLCFNSRKDALHYGRKNVRVHIVSPPPQHNSRTDRAGKRFVQY